MATTNNAKALSTKTGNAQNTRHRKQGRELSYAGSDSDKYILKWHK